MKKLIGKISKYFAAVLDEVHQCENVSKDEIIDRDGRAFAMLGPGLACS